MILKKFGTMLFRYATISQTEMQCANMLNLISRCSSLTSHDAEKNHSLPSQRARNEIQKMEKPKTPLKPFIKFSMKYRSLFRAKYPDANAAEIMKRLALVWNQMSSVDRSVYFDSYAKESDAYFESLREYRIHFNADYQKLLDEKIRRQKNKEESVRKRMLKKYFKMPKRPSNGFLLFSEERKKQENVTMSSREDIRLWLNEMGRAWRKLSDKQKQKYYDEQRKQRAIFDSLVMDWEKEVVEAGYAFLLPESKRIDFQPTNRHYMNKSKEEILRQEKDSVEVLREVEESQDSVEVEAEEQDSVEDEESQ